VELAITLRAVDSSRKCAIASNDNAKLDAIECRSRLGGLLNYYCREAA
jgi:hypothetical protein